MKISEVKQGAPVPPRVKMYPFFEMQPGDYIDVTGSEAELKAAQSAATSYFRRRPSLNKYAITRRMTPTKVRIWVQSRNGAMDQAPSGG